MPDFGQDLLPISGTLRRKRAEARLARAPAYGTDGWRLIAPDDDGEWVVGEATGRLCLPVLIEARLSTAAAWVGAAQTGATGSDLTRFDPPLDPQ